VERAGFEPAKAEPADLQSAPVGHLGTSPLKTLYKYNKKTAELSLNKLSKNRREPLIKMELVMGLEPATC
jgi:hypothetical protein